MMLGSLNRSVVLSVLAGAAASTVAQTADWLNAVSGNWNDLANWSGGTVPDGGGFDVTIDATGAAYEVILNINAELETFLLDSTDATLSANGRVLTVATSATFNAGTVRFNGGGFGGTGTLTNNATMDIANLVNVTTSTFDQAGILNITAGPGFNSNLNRTGDMTNSGTITLSSTSGTTSELNVSGVLTNAASGTITVNAGAGGARDLGVGDLVNNGTVNINASTALNGTSGVYRNNAMWNTAAGTTTTLSGGSLLRFEQNAGTLNNLGTFSVLSERFDFNGGDVLGNNLQISNSAVNNNASGQIGYDLFGTTTWSGNVANGQTVNIIASPGVNSQFNAAAMNNSGVINLTSTSGTFAELNTSGVFLNNADGVVNVEIGAGGTRNLETDSFVNNGEVNLNATTALNANGGVYTNNGTWNIAAGTTTTLSGTAIQRFEQNAGTLNNAGSFVVTAERFDYNGGTITGNNLRISDSAVNNNAAGQVGYDLFGTTTWSGNVANGQTVNIIASPGVNSQFNAAAMNNSGVINLTSTSGTFAELNTSGVFLNNADGVVNVEVGAGGVRNLETSTFTNNGAVNLNATTELNAANAVYSNNGLWNIAAATTTTLSGTGTQRFEQNAGTLNNMGTFRVLAERFDYNGGTVTGNDLQISDSTVNNNAAGQIGYDLFGVTTWSGNLANGQTVSIVAAPGVNAQLNTDAMTNSGMVNLTSTSGTFAELNTTGNFTNNADGIVNVEFGAGGARNLETRSFLNNGDVNLNASTALNAANGVYTNESNWNVAAGTTNTLSGSGTLSFRQNDGVLNNLGTFRVLGERFDFNGGEVLGNNLDIDNSTINNNAAGRVRYDLTGLTTWSGNVSDQQVVNIIATPGVNAQLNASAFTNSGVINLSSLSGTFAELNTSGTFTNNADGVVNVEQGAGGARNLETQMFVNNGVVNVNTNTALNAANGVYQNANAWNIAAGTTTTLSASGIGRFEQNAGVLNNLGTFSVANDRFDFNGGEVLGNNLSMSDSIINNNAAGRVVYDTRGVTTWAGDVSDQQAVNIIATPGVNAQFNAGSFTNSGQITLTSTSGTFAELNSSGTFTNNADGVVTIAQGAGGARFLDMPDLVNNGLIDFNASTDINRANGTVSNAGTFDIASGVEVRVLGSGTITFRNELAGTVTGAGRLDNLGVDVFVNDGTFAPGDGVGTLTYEGDWSQSSQGTLDIEIAGRNAGEFDLLNVTGSAALDGTLRVSISGFLVSNSDSFVIFDAASLAGTFANAPSQVTIVGGGGFFDVVYDENAGTVTLTNFVPAPGSIAVLAAAGLFARRRR